MSNDIDFEPDWNSYHCMDKEEKKARWDLVRLQQRYSDNKISYERYITELSNSYYYDYLSKSDLDEIEDFQNKKKKKAEIHKKNEYKTRQIKIRQKSTTKDYLFIFVLIVSIIGFIIGVLA